eukprot:EG_transcript_18087
MRERISTFHAKLLLLMAFRYPDRTPESASVPGAVQPVWKQLSNSSILKGYTGPCDILNLRCQLPSSLLRFLHRYNNAQAKTRSIRPLSYLPIRLQFLLLTRMKTCSSFCNMSTCDDK